MKKRIWIIPALVFGLICLVTPLTVLADEVSPNPETRIVIQEGPENLSEQDGAENLVEETLEYDALESSKEDSQDLVKKDETAKGEANNNPNQDGEEEPRETTQALEEDLFLNAESLIGQQNLGQSDSPKIYLDGQGGNDDYDGLLIETAFKSFEKAKETAKNNQNIKEILITGTVFVSGDVSLEGTSAIILRDESFNGYLFEVAGDATATLKNITVDGNSEKALGTDKSLIYINENGALNIQGGTVLKNNKIRSLDVTTGGAIRAYSATINMTDGIIKDNEAVYGGGVYLGNSTMNFSGGVVQNNHSKQYYDTSVNQYYSAGGGILADGGSTINLSQDAKILENDADEIGGGISLGSNEWGSTNTLNMTGGTIAGNTAGAAGGGIFVQAKYFDGGASKAYISAGNIINNKMDGKGKTNKAFGGGGIYVNGVIEEYGGNGELYLTNAVITNNTAELQGGGYAACPVSETHIYVTDGAAIYANDASTAQEIYILASNKYGIHSGSPSYTISDTMLGGQLYNWKNDLNELLSLEQLYGSLNASESEHLSLHTNEMANANVEALMRVLISGNESVTRGGGIGSNGSVYIGLADTTEVEIKKTWDDDAYNKKRPESITVKLQRQLRTSNEEPMALQSYIIKADDNGDWKLTISNLAKLDLFGNEYIYSIDEEAIDGYEAEITGDQNKGFEIINSLINKINIHVKKAWIDSDNEHDLRPDHIVVDLLADGILTDKELFLNIANSWSGIFMDLDLFKDGVKILYTVEEKNVPESYTAVVNGNAEEGFIIINSYASPETPEEPPVTPPETPEEPPVTPPETPEEPPVVPPAPPAPPTPPTPPSFLHGSAPQTFDPGMNGSMMLIVLGLFSLLGLGALRRREEEKTV